jgi:uncharacterized linocin/CFP29 family protein
MNHLQRELAPINADAWAAIDAEASRSLRHYLAIRPLVDFSGPHGWAYSAHSLGRVERLPGSAGGGELAGLRRVLPLVELRHPFTLSRDEIDSVERGADDYDLRPVVEAAQRAAVGEDRLVLDGHAPAGITGITQASSEPPLAISDDYDQYPGIVARAVARLRAAGIAGPYGIALGSRCYTGVIETTEHGGYPVLEHIRLIVGGPVIWAAATDGAVVISQRGGDYRIVCGEDFSVGYTGHDQSSVQLYIEETVTFQVVEPRAAVLLRYPA